MRVGVAGCSTLACLFDKLVISSFVFKRHGLHTQFHMLQRENTARTRARTHPRKVSVYSDTRPLVGANNSAAAGVAVREPFGAFTTAADAGLKQTSG